MNVVEAIRAGRSAIIPTDTVYGLATTARDPAALAALYRLKGRDLRRPSALLAADLDALLTAVPELDESLLRELLPGPYTLILPNPARRFAWLCGDAPEAIGVRVPELPRISAEAIAQTGPVVATSANAPGGPDPARLDDVPAELRAGAAAELDAGELPGTPSTVIDLTGPEPRVLREGAGSAERWRSIKS